MTERARVVEEARVWAETLSKARKAVKVAGLDEQSIQVSQAANEALKQIAESGLFRCAFLNRYLQRSSASILNYAITLLNEELSVRTLTAGERQAEFEVETAQRTNQVESALQYKRSVAAAVSRERIALDDKEGVVQQGCACGLVLGCLFLGLYLGFTFLMVMLGKEVAGDSPIGIIFLSMVVAPLGISLLMQLFAGTKRWMVEADLNAKMKQAEGICDKAIEQAETRYRSQEPGLKMRLDEANEQVKCVRESLESLGVVFAAEPEPEPEQESQPDKPIVE
jgi:hypothetical protein